MTNNNAEKEAKQWYFAKKNEVFFGNILHAFQEQGFKLGIKRDDNSDLKMVNKGDQEYLNFIVHYPANFPTDPAILHVEGAEVRIPFPHHQNGREAADLFVKIIREEVRRETRAKRTQTRQKEFSSQAGSRSERNRDSKTQHNTSESKESSTNESKKSSNFARTSTQPFQKNAPTSKPKPTSESKGSLRTAPESKTTKKTSNLTSTSTKTTQKKAPKPKPTAKAKKPTTTKKSPKTKKVRTPTNPPKAKRPIAKKPPKTKKASTQNKLEKPAPKANKPTNSKKPVKTKKTSRSKKPSPKAKNSKTVECRTVAQIKKDLGRYAAAKTGRKPQLCARLRYYVKKYG